MNSHWHDLIQRHMAGLSSDDEASALQDLLKQDNNAAHLYLRYTNLDLALEAKAESMDATRELLTAPAMNRSPRWLSWRPLAAAAAGIVLGMCCTSVVLGFVVPRSKMARQRLVPLFTESYETAQSAPERGFPTKAGSWFGSVDSAIATEGAVKAKDGRSMMRLSAAPSTKRKFSYAYRVVDLADYPMPAEAESRQVEVTAFFHGDSSEDSDRYQIRLAAFAEVPGELRPIWNDEAALFDRVLQHLGRTEITKPGEHDWKSMRALIELPLGARSLVISLGAAMADDFAQRTDHYLDDVQVKFIITESTR